MKDIPLPCIINKCLKYPVCKYKESIDCEEIHIYYNECANQLKRHDDFEDFNSKIIKHLQSVFPNLKEIVRLVIYKDITLTERSSKIFY